MPDFRAYVRQNLPALGVTGEHEAEIVEELALEFQESYESALRRGLSPEDAWKQIHTRSWQELCEELRSALGEPTVQFREPIAPRKLNLFVRIREQLYGDLSYAARQLRKSPGFTIVAVLMLALGIGANTAIFSLLNAVLLRNLPVRQPGQLFLFGKAEQMGSTTFMPQGSTQAFSYPFFREFRQRNQSFSDVAAIQSFPITSHGRIDREAGLEKMRIELVSGSYFNTLGVNALLGRVITDPDDETPGAHPVAVASYSWWQNRFARDPSIVGKTVTIRSTLYTIIGVAAPEFFGISVGQSPNLWIPLSMQKEISPDRNGLDKNLFRCLHMIGRLKPGVSLQQAQVNTDLLFRQILLSYAGPAAPQKQIEGIQHARIELTPAATGRSYLRREFSSPLRILMQIVVLVLLIACANIANLLLARATSRQREIAIRMSMGAERGRIIRQLLAESGLLGLIGGAIGVAFAWAASRLLLTMVSGGSELLPIHVTPDTRVLVFSLALTILTVLLFGTVPALRATRIDLAPVLKSGRGVITAGMGNQLARALVVGQVALSLVLVAGAGLFLRSLVKLTEVDVGFEKHNVLRMHIDPGSAGYQRDDRLTATMRRVEDRIGAMPTVRGASFALSVFDGGGWSEDDVTVPGRPRTDKDPQVDLNLVGPAYFDVMKMPLLLGRGFTDRDNSASRKVAVINETMARTHFAGGSPIGRTFNVGDNPTWQNVEVVGVVKDAKYMELEEDQMPAAFFPYAQQHDRILQNFVARYAGDPGTLVAAIRKAVAEIDPNLPVSDVRTLEQMVDDFTLNRRLVVQLSSFFGILGTVLASIGIYGVMSYGIARRTNEFGIRMALGADRWRVLRLVLREALVLSIIGTAIGLALALASGRLVQSLLFGVKSSNPMVIGVSIATMITVALLAGYLPARRATRIDPSTALRYE